MKEFNLIINGENVATSDYFDVINPADKSVVARCPKASVEQLDTAVAAAKAVFPAWSALTYAERREKLMQLADAILNIIHQSYWIKIACLVHYFSAT